jgi:hypothetical protein
MSVAILVVEILKRPSGLWPFGFGQGQWRLCGLWSVTTKKLLKAPKTQPQHPQHSQHHNNAPIISYTMSILLLSLVMLMMMMFVGLFDSQTDPDCKSAPISITHP